MKVFYQPLCTHLTHSTPTCYKITLPWRRQGGADQGHLTQRSIDTEDTGENIAKTPRARRRRAMDIETVSVTGSVGGLVAHNTVNHPGGMTIEIPNIGAGGIGQQKVETEMADRLEKTPRVKSAGEAEDLSRPRLHHFKQTRTQMQWLWRAKRYQTKRSLTSPQPVC